MARRIQRKRTKGWRMPSGAIYVGRPTRWRNPFRVGGWFMLGDPDPQISRTPLRLSYCESYAAGEPGYTLIETREQAVDWFRRYVANWNPAVLDLCARELRGHDLACFCRIDQPCHADVLLDLANPAASLPETPEAT